MWHLTRLVPTSYGVRDKTPSLASRVCGHARGMGAVGFTSVLCCAGFAHGQCETAQLPVGLGPETSYPTGAMDGNRVAAGDQGPPFDKDPRTIGSIKIYERAGFEWKLDATILEPISDPLEAGMFSYSLSLQGDLTLAGSPQLPLSGLNFGAVFAFLKIGGSWELGATLLPSDSDGIDFFGFSVDIDGEWAVVGARDASVNELYKPGAAYVFHYDENTHAWTEFQKLTAFEPETFRLFGQSVGISGDMIVVGAHGGGNPSYFSGSAYVFRFDGEKWVDEVELIPFDGQNGDQFGGSVSIENDVLAVGAFQGGPIDRPATGAVYLYRYLDSQWQFEQKLLPLAYEGCCPTFGRDVDLNPAADTLLVGASGDHAAGFQAGSVHVFHRIDGAWVGIPPIYSSTAEAFGQFSQVQASGDRATVGAFDGPGDTGLVHVIDGIRGIDCNNNGQADACDIFYGVSGDRDGDRIPDECDIAADINSDGVVGPADLAELLAQWGDCTVRLECSADLDQDGVVGPSDLVEILAAWT